MENVKRSFRGRQSNRMSFMRPSHILVEPRMGHIHVKVWGKLCAPCLGNNGHPGWQAGDTAWTCVPCVGGRAGQVPPSWESEKDPT